MAPPKLHHDPSSLVSLPTELLIQILTHLDPSDVFGRISLVCRRLNEISSSIAGGGRGIWTEITLGPTLTSRQARILIQQLRLGLKKVTLERGGAAALAIEALQTCEGLESFTVNSVTGCSGFSSFLEAVGERRSLRKICLRHITHLRLGSDDSSTFSKSFGDGEMAAIADLFPRLQSFHLHCSCVHGITGEGLRYFLDRTHETLRSLRLPRNLSTWGSVFEPVGRCPLLETLGSVPTLRWLSGLTRLRHLEMGGIVIGGERLDFAHLRGLTRLTFRSIWDLCDADLESVALNCPELKELEFHRLWDRFPFLGLRSVLRGCGNLVRLSLCDVEGRLRRGDFRGLVAPLRVLRVDWPREDDDDCSSSLEELREIVKLVPGRLMIQDCRKASRWLGDPL